MNPSSFASAVFKPFDQPALPAAYRTRTLHLIDGKHVEPSGGIWFDAVDPSTGMITRKCRK